MGYGDSPHKQRRPFILVAITVAVFLLLSTSLVLATEMGVKTGVDKIYNSFCFEKVWGGAPVDGNLALLNTSKAMQEIKAAHFVPEIDLSSSYDQQNHSPTFQSFLSDKARYVLAPQSSNILGVNSKTSNSLNYSNQTSLTIKLDGDFSEEQLESRISIESPLINQALSYYGLGSVAGNAVAIDIKSTDEKIFLRVPALSLIRGSKNNKWFQFDKRDIGYMLEDSVENAKNPLQDISKYQNVITGSNRMGIEKVNGIKTTKYQLKIDSNRLINLFDEPMYSSVIAEKPPEINIFFWYGNKDKLTHKFEVIVSGQAQGATINIDTDITLSNFGKDINVGIPTDDEIDDGGFMNLFSMNSNASINKNDVYRVSELRTLKSALALYQSDVGSYPISREICYVGSEECSVLDVLEGQYINQLSVDPSGD